MSIRKRHTVFLDFHFWDLKLVPIDSALNSAQDNLTFVFRNGTKKVSQLWKSRLKFLECPLSSIAGKLENIWTKIFLQEVGQESCGWKSICQILIPFLWLVTPPCFLVKISQILQKVVVFFPGKRREDKDLILTCLDSSVTENYRTAAYFLDFDNLQEEKRGQSWTKCANFESIIQRFLIQWFFWLE